MSSLLESLVESPVVTSLAFGDFFTDEHGIKEHTKQSVEAEGEGTKVILTAMSKKPVSEELLGFRLRDIPHKCPDLINLLGRHMESIIQTIPNDEIGHASKVSGMHGQEVVYEAPVTADYLRADFTGQSWVEVLPDMRINIWIEVFVPNIVGEFTRAYP
jgi:hypothetical protein